MFDGLMAAQEQKLSFVIERLLSNALLSFVDCRSAAVDGQAMNTRPHVALSAPSLVA